MAIEGSGGKGLHQPALFTADPSRFDRFLEFHQAHPDVYALFKRFTLEVFRRGHRRFGARAIWERMRWHLAIDVADEAAHKLNDHFVPYYARLVMLRNPHLDGMFSRRDRRFDVDDDTLLRAAARIGGPA